MKYNPHLIASIHIISLNQNKGIGGTLGGSVVPIIFVATYGQFLGRACAITYEVVRLDKAFWDLPSDQNDMLFLLKLGRKL